MKKPESRKPFFSRLLEGQRGERDGDEKEGKSTERPPGEDQPPHTMKYPSDSDEK